MKKIKLLFLFIITFSTAIGCSDDNNDNKKTDPSFDVPDMKWTTYDWELTKTTITAPFELDGILPSNTSINIECLFGKSENDLKKVSYTTVGAAGLYKYKTERLSNLQPNTLYILRVDYWVGDKRRSITKTIKTLPDYSEVIVDKTVKPVSHKIEWGSQPQMKQISPSNIVAAYPRIIKKNGVLFCFYHGGTSGTPFSDIYVQKSIDDGITWTEARSIISINEAQYKNNYKRFLNPEILQLDNGNMLLSLSAIGTPETNENCHTLIMTSEDNGQTWSHPIIAGRGRSWEPMVAKLPNGELELLVSSEAQWWQNTNPMPQEILCARSTDNGQTWTKYIRAAYSTDRRDGMPSAVVMQGNKGILFSIEVIKDGGFGSPSFIHRDLNGEWDLIPWDGKASDNRWHVDIAVNNGSVHGAAPYTIQLSTGEIVIMAQVNPKNNIWQTAYPRVTICDNTGHNPTERTTPVGAMGGSEGFYYGSLFQKDENTIWLAASHCIYSGSTLISSQIKFIEGKIINK